MKYNSRKILSLILLLISLSIQSFAQNVEKNEQTREEKQNEITEIEMFVDSFFKSYSESFDLTKVPETYFVKDYEKNGYDSMLFEEYDKYLTEDERVQNYFQFLDFSTLAFITMLEESDFDFESFNEKTDNENIFPKKITQLFLKYPKLEFYIGEGKDLDIKDVNEFKEVNKEFQNLVQELRSSLSQENKIKFLNFLEKNKKNIFEYKYSFKSSNDRFKEFPENTEMHYYRAFIFDLQITKVNNQWRIVVIYPLSD